MDMGTKWAAQIDAISAYKKKGKIKYVTESFAVLIINTQSKFISNDTVWYAMKNQHVKRCHNKWSKMEE